MRAGFLALLGAAMLCVGAPRASAQAVKIPITGVGYGTSDDVLLLEEVRQGNTIHVHEIFEAHYVYYIWVAPDFALPLPMTVRMELTGKYDQTYSGAISGFGWQVDAAGNRIGSLMHGSALRQLGPDGLWHTEWHYNSTTPTGNMYIRDHVTMPDHYNFTSTVEGWMIMTPPMLR